MTFEHIPSKYTHLNVFLWNETLFVWSKTTKSLYSFLEVYGVLFFLMEEKRDKASVANYLKDLHIVDAKIDQLVEMIRSLLDDKEKVRDEPLYEILEIPSIKSLKSGITYQKVYKLYHTEFLLIVDSTIESMIDKDFNHLLYPSHTDSPKYIFEIIKEDKSYLLKINDKVVQKDIQREQLLALLHDYIRITIYENSDFFVAFHAALLTYKGVPFIFPAVSGSGKSTLSSFLMQKKDFAFYSDEVVVLDKNYKIEPLPLRIVLKQGSWKLFEALSLEMEGLEVYNRFDDQKIKFFLPKNIAKDAVDAKTGYMVFPTYKESVEASLSQISLVEAISLVVASGYHLKDPDDFEVVQLFLVYLSKMKLYRLVYSDLDEAYRLIKGINEKDR